MLRAGRIAYTNDLPIYAAYDVGARRFPGTLHAAVPSELNAMLATGALDLSPVSAFHYAKNAKDYVLLPDPCIGARADVWSVLVVSRTPLADLDGADILVTRESASGRNLLRVLLERRYRIRANFIDADDGMRAFREAGTPTLVIGDSAIRARAEFDAAYVHDLGRIWHDWTGGDMTFAVWAARRDVYEDDPASILAAAASLTSARAWGSTHLDTVIEQARFVVDRPASWFRDYYATLNFLFDAQARAGLRRYCEELAMIGAIDEVPDSEAALVAC